MSRFIQTLESRTMFSVSPIAPYVAPHVSSVPHSVAPVKVTQPIYFQGTAVNFDGSLNADLLITLKPTDKGATANVTVLNPNGKTTTAALVFNAQGQFTYTRKDAGSSTIITGQISADRQTITATGTNTDTNGTSTMTITCARTGTAPTAANYTGVAIGTAKQRMGLNGTFYKTDTGYIGIVSPTMQNPDNNGRTGVLVNINLAGSFSVTILDGTGALKLSVSGQMSSNGKTITGSLTDVENGVANQGTFTLKRT